MFYSQFRCVHCKTLECWQMFCHSVRLWGACSGEEVVLTYSVPERALEKTWAVMADILGGFLRITWFPRDSRGMGVKFTIHGLTGTVQGKKSMAAGRTGNHNSYLTVITVGQFINNYGALNHKKTNILWKNPAVCAACGRHTAPSSASDALQSTAFRWGVSNTPEWSREGAICSRAPVSWFTSSVYLEQLLTDWSPSLPMQVHTF